MAVSCIKAMFSSDIHTVWSIITDVEHCVWRSDLSKTEVLNEKQFVEYTKEGYATTFTITVKEPYRRWEFDMENGNMKGHWTGILTERDGQTEIDFTEDVTPKKWWMKQSNRNYIFPICEKHWRKQDENKIVRVVGRLCRRHAPVTLGSGHASVVFCDRSNIRRGRGNFRRKRHQGAVERTCYCSDSVFAWSMDIAQQIDHAQTITSS